MRRMNGARERRAAAGAGVASAANARTVVEALAWHVERAPERTHIHLREENGDETPLTYGWLWREAQAVAGGLAARGLGRGETVAIMLRTERRFFPTFIGTLMAGCVPVPLYPPFRLDRIEEYVHRQVAILHNAGARILVTFSEVERVAGAARATGAVTRRGGHRGRRDRRAAPSRPGHRGRPGAHPVHLGQHRQPKGVLLSHDNLLANIRAIERRFEITSHDVGVSWLPLYHDMGLIGAWLGPLYFGATAGPDVAARVPGPANPLAQARSTTIAARCRRRPTSPLTSARPVSPSRRSRGST